MSGPLVWWANRKSRLGLSPVAKEPPPKSPGRPWWTTPPTAPPLVEHMEYVVQFRATLVGQKQSRRRDQMIVHVNAWLAAARRQLHYAQQSPHRTDLHTTDGVIVAASRAMQKMRILIIGLGGDVDEEVAETIQVVHGRAERIRHERATTVAVVSKRDVAEARRPTKVST